MDKKIKVAVIGYGNLGKWHAEKAFTFSKDIIDLVAIVDIKEEARERARAAYPTVPVVTEISEVTDQIDAAVIVTPISTHFELTEYLLQKGKHVFCEKSFTETHEQALILEKLVKDKNKILQVGHSERFHEVWDNVSKYPQFFNDPAFIRISRLGPFRNRDADVSVVEDLMVHDIDLLLYLFKEIPETVKATGFKVRSDKWDMVLADFSYKSGRRAVVTVGRNFVKVMREMEITNSSGCLLVDLLNTELLYAPDKTLDNGSVVQQVPYSKRDHLYLEQEYFYRSINEMSDPIIGIHDGVIASKIISKVLDSLNQQITVNI